MAFETETVDCGISVHRCALVGTRTCRALKMFGEFLGFGGIAITGYQSTGSVSRRHDADRVKMRESEEFNKLISAENRIRQLNGVRPAILQFNRPGNINRTLRETLSLFNNKPVW
jgi:hypothetical protein